MDTSDVKIVTRIVIGFIGLFLSVSGGIVLDSYITQRSAQACIEADKVWIENSCVEQAEDVRYASKS